MVGWTEDADPAPASYGLHVGAGATAQRVDVMGNREDQTVAGDGTLALKIGHEPTYLVIEGSDVRPERIEAR